ncbi:MAG: tetraacyldisaccharide 4'-kinase, partial [Desulfobacterales bacterium]|nr:tetraacyldisaccharide 4'-kinase [Desulfobacterales bacterium]
MIKTWLARLEKRVESIIEKDYTPAPFSFEQLLVVCSQVYMAAARLRIAMYRSGLFKQKKLPCKVISIGNVAVGGSGKTPMAIYLAEMLIEHGLHPVVVSRGYKGKLDKPAAIVGDGTKVLMDTETAGDEP